MNEINMDEVRSEKKKTTALAVPVPVKVLVGESYRFLLENRVVSAKIEKIYNDENDVPYIVVTLVRPVGRRDGVLNLFARSRSVTSSMPAAEFKLRMLHGGLEDLEL